MPLQRRLPKTGFRSKMSPLVAQVRLSELAKLQGHEVTLDSLKAANLIPLHVLRARVMSSGKVEKAYTVRGIHLTKGARAAIEAAGGKLEEVAA
jgi:large subunit ribosomal protein L15